MTAPINVRIASLVGYTDIQSIGIRGGVEKWVGRKPCAERSSSREKTLHGITTPCLGCWFTGFDPIPDYEHDWSATGPLIERFGIALTPPSVMPSKQWAASVPSEMGAHHNYICRAAYPLEAVCNVLIALSERAAQNEGE